MTGHQIRLEKAESFYKRLTVAYSMLCREKDTPLTMKWEDVTGSSNHERDAALESAYSQLQHAFRKFCTYNSPDSFPVTILTVNKQAKES